MVIEGPFETISPLIVLFAIVAFVAAFATVICPFTVLSVNVILAWLNVTLPNVLLVAIAFLLIVVVLSVFTLPYTVAFPGIVKVTPLINVLFIKVPPAPAVMALPVALNMLFSILDSGGAPWITLHIPPPLGVLTVQLMTDMFLATPSLISCGIYSPWYSAGPSSRL